MWWILGLIVLMLFSKFVTKVVLVMLALFIFSMLIAIFQMSNAAIFVVIIILAIIFYLGHSLLDAVA